MTGLSYSAPVKAISEQEGTMDKATTSPASDEYIKVVENDKLFKKVISQEGLTSAAIAIKYEKEGSEDFEDGLIVVQGTSIENDHMGVYAFVNPVTKDVESISKFVVEGTELNDIVTFVEYNTNGTVVLEYETTVEKVQNQEANFLEDYNSISDHGISLLAVDKGSKWFQFACNFSTAVACTAGCVAFSGPAAIACSIACSTVAGTFACG